MQTNLTKGIEKIFIEFGKLNKYTKTMLKYGFIIFLALFAIGTLLVVINHTSYNNDTYIEFIANSIIKSSFTILAEIIIGGLLIDFVFNKN